MCSKLWSQKILLSRPLVLHGGQLARPFLRLGGRGSDVHHVGDIVDEGVDGGGGWGDVVLDEDLRG